MKSEEFKKYSIVVSCFSRAELLDTCLNSITLSADFEDYNLIVLHQTGYDAVARVIESYSERIDATIVVNSQISTPIGNINWNRFATYKIAFDLYDSEFVLGIEEDIEIASDSLSFLKTVHKRYGNDRSFRGVNLGSIAINGNSSEYNLLRYGLHGQAGTITRDTWQALPLNVIEENLFDFPLDSMFEAYLKTGFMVTPLRSKYLDRGWGGTHAPKDSSDKHYLNVQESFINEENDDYTLTRSAPNPSWRYDCAVYRKSHNPFYWVVYQISLVGLRTKVEFILKVSSKLSNLFQKKFQSPT
jgi:hypothetical protein